MHASPCLAQNVLHVPPLSPTLTRAEHRPHTGPLYPVQSGGEQPSAKENRMAIVFSAIRKQCEVAKLVSNSIMGQGAVGSSHTMMPYIAVTYTAMTYIDIVSVGQRVVRCSRIKKTISCSSRSVPVWENNQFVLKIRRTTQALGILLFSPRKSTISEVRRGWPGFGFSQIEKCIGRGGNNVM